MSELEGAIAATRFGSARRPGEIKAACFRSAAAWLKAQIRADAGYDPRWRTRFPALGDRSRNRVDDYGQRPSMPKEHAEGRGWSSRERSG